MFSTLGSTRVDRTTSEAAASCSLLRLGIINGRLWSGRSTHHNEKSIPGVSEGKEEGALHVLPSPKFLGETKLSKERNTRSKVYRLCRRYSDITGKVLNIMTKTMKKREEWVVVRDTTGGGNRIYHRRMVSSGLLRRVDLLRTDVSEEPGASFIRVTKIGELGTTQAATSNRPMKEAPGSSETSVLTRATRRNNPEDTILHSHRRENLKSYRIYHRF
jgi:hypothetical protein